MFVVLLSSVQYARKVRAASTDQKEGEHVLYVSVRALSSARVTVPFREPWLMLHGSSEAEYGILYAESDVAVCTLYLKGQSCADTRCSIAQCSRMV